MRKIPKKYVPNILSKKDKIKQKEMIIKSRNLYKQGKYYTRKKVASYPHKISQHIIKARKLYDINTLKPSNELSKKTGCSMRGLNKIVNKGKGAYYSSGSRPNQTAESWAYARLASAITGGKSAIVDFHIIDKECLHDKMAYKLAHKTYKNKK